MPAQMPAPIKAPTALNKTPRPKLAPAASLDGFLEGAASSPSPFLVVSFRAFFKSKPHATQITAPSGSGTRQLGHSALRFGATGADDVEEVRLSTEGALWAWTAVTAPPPGYEGPVPYGFGVVELEAEGLRLVTRLTEPDPAELRAGQRMRLVVEHLPGDLAIWAFAPVEEDER